MMETDPKKLTSSPIHVLPNAEREITGRKPTRESYKIDVRYYKSSLLQQEDQLANGFVH